MACPKCDSTMQGLCGKAELRWYWCPRCGTVKQGQQRIPWHVPVDFVLQQLAIKAADVLIENNKKIMEQMQELIDKISELRSDIEGPADDQARYDGVTVTGRDRDVTKEED